MDAQAATAPTMRAPERWLAVLRIAVGLWFAKALSTKLSVTLLWGFLPVPATSERWQHVMPLLVGKYAEGNPVGFFRNFMQQVVIAPHTAALSPHEDRRIAELFATNLRRLIDGKELLNVVDIDHFY